MSESVSIVIPNWNGCRLLIDCLRSLSRQVYEDYRIYVVDNGSTDGSVAAVEAAFPHVVMIALPENLGFAAAMNIGFSRCEGRFLVALNNDTTVAETWLQVLVATLTARPEIDFAASMILCHDDPSVIDCIGDGYGWAGLSFKIGDRHAVGGCRGQPFEILSACAAAAIYRREVIAAVGGFDEAFFAYMEDVDLSLRARLAGYRCFAVPSAVVLHIGSASTGGDCSAFSIRMTARNMIFLLIKTIPAPILAFMLPVVVVGQVALLGLCLTTGRYPGLRRHLGAYATGLGEGLRGIPMMMRKRSAVQASRRITVSAFVRMMRLSQAQGRNPTPRRLSWSAE